MLIDCSHCHAQVNGEEVHVAEWVAPWDDPDPWEEPYRISILRCPRCKRFLVGLQNSVQEAEIFWTLATRVWPEPVSELAMSIPLEIRQSLAESRKCFNASAYIASVAMCGRAIEALCQHFSTKQPTFFDGLMELHDADIIDSRLYSWGQELREHRNLAAHPSTTVFRREDAKDLYEFSAAICEYVFVLTEKFEQFKGRRERRAKKIAQSTADS
jgi:hypothetical protein